MADTVTIPRKEYERLKQLEADHAVDWELVDGFHRSLADLKAGRIKRVA